MTTDPLTTQALAIKAAISNQWETAIELNQSLLVLNPKDISALNRLGTAYFHNNNFELATATFKRVTSIDPYNTIAITQLLKLKSHQGAPRKPQTMAASISIRFIEEPGKSKVLPLFKPGEPKVLNHLTVGQELLLKIAARKIKVITQDGGYIGYLSDDISAHLMKLIKQGNKYLTYLKSSDHKRPEVFIKEIKRCKKYFDTPSFIIQPKDGSFYNGIYEDQVSVPPLEIYDPLLPPDESMDE